jgi:hypothetical protein
MPQTISADAGARRVVGAEVVVLLILCALAFRSEIGTAISMAVQNWDAAHLLAAPVLILILLHRRRRELARHPVAGSVWGPVLILLGFAFWFVSTWPFNYAYTRRLAVVPALAGIVLAVGGWRVLRLCLPMLLIALIAVPMGSQYYAILMARPERQTVAAACATLDALPGVLVDRDGLDMSYVKGSEAGTIALGEPMRGASLLLSFLTILVFVTSARMRPLWQPGGMAILAIPLIMLCNYGRLLIHGLMTIYGGANPLSSMPRVTAAVLSLLFAYGLSVLMLWIMRRIIVEEGAQVMSGGPVTGGARDMEISREPTRPRWRSAWSVLPLVSASLFLAAAVGLRPGAEALIRHYRKEPIELRKPLREFDAGEMQTFRLVPASSGFTRGTEAAGGRVEEQLSLVFEDLPPGEAGSAQPDVRLTVIYEGDPDRQVPYPPELIYRQSGAVVEGVRAIDVDTPDLAPDPSGVPARFLDIKQNDDHFILIYLYCCNGEFYDDREEVRFAISWPGDKYAYFSRVEALMEWPPGMSRLDATERCQRLLSEAVPILVRDHFPRREDLRGR